MQNLPVDISLQVAGDNSKFVQRKPAVVQLNVGPMAPQEAKQTTKLKSAISAGAVGLGLSCVVISLVLFGGRRDVRTFIALLVVGLVFTFAGVASLSIGCYQRRIQRKPSGEARNIGRGT